MAALPMPYRFSVDDYYRMAEVGLLPPDVRTELFEGEILQMAPIGVRHAECVNRFTMTFARLFGDQAVVSVQNPVRLDNHSEPQPDVTLVRLRPDGRPLAHPTPSDVLLLVEVADSTLRFDRLRKAPAYARTGVAEVWIVDVEARVIERYRDPADGTYRRVDTVAAGCAMSPAFCPDVAISVDELIP